MTQNLPPFSCTADHTFVELIHELGCSIAISTYQAGKVIFLSGGPNGLIQLPRNFTKPMGMAFDGTRLAVATREEVVVLANAPGLAPGYPASPHTYDALFVPRAVYFSGEVDLHDMAWSGRTLWAVNTRFSCLCHIDELFSFVPQWQPPFVSDLMPDDRCHLNGMAMAGGQPRYITALGATDSPKGWRENKTGGGILMSVPEGEIILRDLPMPHSPRVYGHRLLMLHSATGELVEVDQRAGRYETIARLPAFVRGLARLGEYLFVGMSKLRQGRPLGDIPLARQELASGVAAIHLPSGRVVGSVRYLTACEEIYDVHVLPGMRRPGIVGLDHPMHRRALTTPRYVFWSEPEEPQNQTTG